MASARPPTRAIELARTTAPGLLGTLLPVAPDLPVAPLAAVFVKVVMTTVLDGLAVVERLPAPVVTAVAVVMVVCCVVSVVLALWDSPVDEVVGGAVLLPLPLLPAAAEMAKGKEYWKMDVSDSRMMRMPYVASLPRVLLTAQEYWPAELSTPAVGERETVSSDAHLTGILAAKRATATAATHLR